jgi:hypothetical protein
MGGATVGALSRPRRSRRRGSPVPLVSLLHQGGCGSLTTKSVRWLRLSQPRSRRPSSPPTGPWCGRQCAPGRTPAQIRLNAERDCGPRGPADLTLLHQGDSGRDEARAARLRLGLDSLVNGEVCQLVGYPKLTTVRGGPSGATEPPVCTVTTRSEAKGRQGNRSRPSGRRRAAATLFSRWAAAPVAAIHRRRQDDVTRLRKGEKRTRRRLADHLPEGVEVCGPLAWLSQQRSSGPGWRAS